MREAIDSHIDEFSVHRAIDEIWSVIATTNAYVNRSEPWKLAKLGANGALRDVLAEIYATLRCIGAELAPFLPETSRKISAALDASTPIQLFPRDR